MSAADNSRKMQIAKRIREARKMAGLSQENTAKFLDIPRPSISEIEKGVRSVSAEEIAKFSEIFDVDVAWLLGTDDQLSDPRLQLAARELEKLDPKNLERLLRILASTKESS